VLAACSGGTPSTVVKDMFKAAQKDDLEKFSIAFSKEEMDDEEEIKAGLEIFKMLTKEPEFKDVKYVDAKKKDLNKDFVEEMNDDLSSENWELVLMTYEDEEDAVAWFLKKEDGKYRIFDTDVVYLDEIYK